MSSASARHPLGLVVVCIVEFCERFASLLLSALLVIYLTEQQRLGAGDAVRLAGYLQALGYVAALAGGAVADRIGYRLTVAAGLAMLLVGFSLLAMGSPRAALLAAPAMVVGNGLFKPSVTALLGTLYRRSDERRGHGFGWFYLTVNIAGTVAPLAGGMLRTRYGWSAGFGVAAVMVGLGLLTLLIGSAVLQPAGTGEDTDQPGIPRERHVARWMAVGGVMVALGVLGVAYTQSTGTLLLWARDYSRRELWGYVLPPDSFAALPSLIVLLLAPVLAGVWRVLRRYRREPSDAAKLALGLLCTAIGYLVMVLADLRRGSGLASPLWQLGCKLGLTLGEMIALPSGLALASALAPGRRAALSMGLSFAAQAIGFWLGGAVGGLWGRWAPARFFAALAGGTMAAGLLVALSMLRRRAAATSGPPGSPP